MHLQTIILVYLNHFRQNLARIQYLVSVHTKTSSLTRVVSEKIGLLRATSSDPAASPPKTAATGPGAGLRQLGVGENPENRHLAKSVQDILRAPQSVFFSPQPVSPRAGPQSGEGKASIERGRRHSRPPTGGSPMRAPGTRHGGGMTFERLRSSVSRDASSAAAETGLGSATRRQDSYDADDDELMLLLSNDELVHHCRVQRTHQQTIETFHSYQGFFPTSLAKPCGHLKDCLQSVQYHQLFLDKKW